jgi:hypothetical protein
MIRQELPSERRGRISDPAIEGVTGGRGRWLGPVRIQHPVFSGPGGWGGEHEAAPMTLRCLLFADRRPPRRTTKLEAKLKHGPRRTAGGRW